MVGYQNKRKHQRKTNIYFIPKEKEIYCCFRKGSMTVGTGIGMLFFGITVSVVVLFVIIKAIEVTDNERINRDKD